MSYAAWSVVAFEQPTAAKWNQLGDNDAYLKSTILPLENGRWELCSETWTRTGNHTFTVSGDQTAKYRKYAKIRYKDGGNYEYGIIASSSYSSPNTTVTLIVNTDYAMAATTITDTYISFSDNPQGFPDQFSYTPTVTGFTSNPTVSIKYTVKKGVCIIGLPRIEGTSNAGTVTITLPVLPSTGAFVPIFCYDADAWQVTPAYFTISAGNATATAYKTLLSNFTASGGKKIAEGYITYLI